MRLAQIERQLLQRLAAFGGPSEQEAGASYGVASADISAPRTILDDTDLLDALNGMRSELQSIHSAREEADTVSQELGRFSALYSPVAGEFVRLWRVVQGAQALDRLYSVSLNTVRRVFFAIVVEEAKRDV